MPIRQSPAIFLQQAISACVIVVLGKQAKAGIAVHKKTRQNTNIERHFVIDKCYLPQLPTQETQQALGAKDGFRCSSRADQCLRQVHIK